MNLFWQKNSKCEWLRSEGIWKGIKSARLSWDGIFVRVCEDYLRDFHLYFSDFTLFSIIQKEMNENLPLLR